MKETLILLAILLTSIIGKSQDTVNNRADTSKLSWTKVYNDTKHALSGLAAGLKTTVEHVYTILIKQQIVQSVVFLSEIILTIVLFLILSIGLVKNLKLYHNENHSFNGDNIEDHTSTILLIIFSILSGIMMCCVIGNVFAEMITGFVNPEYGAMRDIISMFK